jgi:hypothetical protein
MPGKSRTKMSTHMMLAPSTHAAKVSEEENSESRRRHTHAAYTCHNPSSSIIVQRHLAYSPEAPAGVGLMARALVGLVVLQKSDPAHGQSKSVYNAGMISCGLEI